MAERSTRTRKNVKSYKTLPENISLLLIGVKDPLF